ncbi:MAG: ATP synthase F1 subunit delta [Dehalococcoidia bacterium]|jgi:F-type H+-transporting ATPase subunit delta|nr:MAG: ATP synthase F1 subunit delta [Dehalococcoidia bacterium]
MTIRLAARRYARAIFEIALERNELDKWQADLASLAGLKKDEAVLSWLANPRADGGLKTQYLEQLGLGPLGQNLAHLLLGKGRLGMADEIDDEYQRLVARHQGLETAEVTTAVPLSDVEKENLAKRLGTVTGKKVVLKTAVDTQIIGGITARINDQLLDGSTRRRLLDLKKAISGGR